MPVLPVLGKDNRQFIMMDVGANARDVNQRMFTIWYCLVATIQNTFLVTKPNSRLIK